MPLSERSFVLLSRLKSIESDKLVGTEQDDLIRDTFKQILSNGDAYKIDEIEKWLDNEQKINPAVAERILNVAHYQKAKYDAKNPLKIAHDGCGCGGDC
jgi:hypothetical protein